MTRLPLFKRGVVVAHALVDDEDFERVSGVRWAAHSDGYACRSVRVAGVVRTYLLHRVIVGLEFGDARQVDHRNRDRLDCRRENLRVVTSAQNAQNIVRFGGTSRFRGVSWDSRRERWQAVLTVAGERAYLGRYRDELEAALRVERERAERCPFAMPDPELARALAVAA